MAVEKKQVMDVAKPGKSTPSATSRPIIVNHGAIMKDPMVNKEAEIPGNVTIVKTSSADSPPSHAERVLQPPEPSVPEKSTPSPAEEPPAPPEPDTSDEGVESAIVDAVAEQAGAKKKNKDQDAEQKARDEAINKLIDDKKYFVPTGQVQKRRNRNALLIVLIVVVLAGAAVMAVDAEVINIGVKLPFDFIKS